MYHCNFTLDIPDPRYLELEVASPGVDLCQCISVILPWISRIPVCRTLGRVPGRGLVSVYHCNFTLDILDLRYLGLDVASPSVNLCQCITVILPWISRIPGISNLRSRPRVWTCVSVSL